MQEKMDNRADKIQELIEKRQSEAVDASHEFII